MLCHYEVLGVSQKATDDELKKSYRKMALQWHPDKNPDKLEEAKAQFQLIQAAYETLSDPHERAFYDRNRENILRGKGSGNDAKSEKLDLFAFFRSSCYDRFDDSEKGFYTVYRQVFELITSKDMLYMDEEEDISIPNFGRSDTDLEDVAQFYGYWSSYCTSLSFAWVDEYDIRQAPNRWVEKKVERENRKIRDKARKEFNEEVRTLVAFVRKRDKRWLARKKLMEEKVAENARKQAAEQQRHRNERKKMLQETMEEQKQHLEEYEHQLRAMEAQFASEWGSNENKVEEQCELKENNEEGEEGQEELLYADLYCVACNKSFRTEKSRESHNRSKKHLENVATLKTAMAEQDHLFLDASIISELGLDASASDDSLLPVLESTGKKKKKKRKNGANREVLLKEKDSNNENETGKVCSSEIEEEKEININGKTIDKETEAAALKIADEVASISQLSNNGATEGKPKLKGKKAKDARKKAREAASVAEDEPNNEMQVDDLRCSICGSEFPSKNKLFTHIKSQGHAAIKTEESVRKGRRK